MLPENEQDFMDGLILSIDTFYGTGMVGKLDFDLGISRPVLVTWRIYWTETAFSMNIHSLTIDYNLYQTHLDSFHQKLILPLLISEYHLS
jgi:hypothetical protein